MLTEPPSLPPTAIALMYSWLDIPQTLFGRFWLSKMSTEHFKPLVFKLATSGLDSISDLTGWIQPLTLTL